LFSWFIIYFFKRCVLIIWLTGFFKALDIDEVTHFKKKQHFLADFYNMDLDYQSQKSSEQLKMNWTRFLRKLIGIKFIITDNLNFNQMSPKYP